MNLGILQKDVARLIGVTALTVKNWELGQTEPEIRYGPAIIDFLGYLPISAKRNLPERLAAYRWIHGYSQEKAAAYLGVDETTWRKWEAGLSRPSSASMALLLETVEH